MPARKAPGGNKAPKSVVKSGRKVASYTNKVRTPRPKGGAAGGRGY